MKRRGRRGIGGTKVDYGPENLGVHSKFSFGKSQAYWGEFDPQTIEEVRSRPEVAYIEEDTVVKKQALVRDSAFPPDSARANSSVEITRESAMGTGKNITENIDSFCISLRFISRFRNHGICIGHCKHTLQSPHRNSLIFHQGVDVTHPDFDGRATWGTTTAPYATDEDVRTPINPLSIILSLTPSPVGWPRNPRRRHHRRKNTRRRKKRIHRRRQSPRRRRLRCHEQHHYGDPMGRQPSSGKESYHKHVARRTEITGDEHGC